MKTIKFIAATSLITINVACGGGGDGEKAEEIKAQDSKTLFSEALSLPYFERQTDENCAIHATNMALGDHFISPKYYDKYTMLIGAREVATTGFFEERLISLNQYQALVDFHRTENESEDLHIRIENLKRQFNNVNLAPGAIDFSTYLNYTGILGGMKTVEEVIVAINGIYTLNLPNSLDNFNEDNKNNLLHNLENISSLVVYYTSEDVPKDAPSSGDGHFFALRKYQNFWYRLNSLYQGPEIISNNNLIDWLEEFRLNHHNVRTIQFTSAQLEEAKKALIRTPPSVIEKRFSSFLRPEFSLHSAIASSVTSGAPSNKQVASSSLLELASPPSSLTLSQGSLNKTVYFEKYDQEAPQDIALGIVHMALGEHLITPKTLGEQRLITPDEYERYMNLIAIKNNPQVSGRQRRLMRKYYDGGKITGELYTQEDLAAGWNPTPNGNSISYTEYLRQTGVFDQQKHIENVIRTINGLYNLNLPNGFDIVSNANLEKAERIMVDIYGSITVLRRDAENKWWLLDSLGEGPECISEDHKNWLNYATQISPTINILCFTAEDILSIKNSTKNLPKLFKDSITNSDPYGEDFIEEYFYPPTIDFSELQNISNDLFEEQQAFRNDTYKFLSDFNARLSARYGVNRSQILRIFISFLHQTPSLDSSSRGTQINKATIEAFKKAAEKWGVAQVHQQPH